MSIDAKEAERNVPQEATDQAVELLEDCIFSKVLDRAAQLIICASAVYIIYHLLRAFWVLAQN